MSLDPAKLAALLAPILDALRAPDAAPMPRQSLAVVFMTRKRFARRACLSVRTVDALIDRGLPVIGKARLLRVDVVAADAWLRAHLGEQVEAPEPVADEDPDAALARKNASRGSK